MATPKKTDAVTLFEKVWGSDFIQSIPARWRASFKYNKQKTPGVDNNTDPDEIIGLVVSSQVTTNRTNELEKETVALDAELETGPQLGQEFNDRLAADIEFVETLEVAGSGIGEPGVIVSPVNSQLYEVRRANPALPEPRVSYGYRKEDLPLTLVSLAIVGSETREAVPTFLAPPDIFLARYTRTYALAPANPGPPLFLSPQPFHGVVEYSETSNSSATGHNIQDSDGTRSGTHHSETTASSGQSHREGTSDNSSHNTGSGSETFNRYTDTEYRHNDRTGQASTVITNNSNDTFTDTEVGTENGNNFDKDVTGVRTSVSSNQQDRNTNVDSDDTDSYGDSHGHSNDTSIRDGTSHTEHSEDSTFDETSSNSGLSNSTEHSHNDSTTVLFTQATTRLNLLRLTLPPCLHDQITIGGFSLPPTNPIALPWNDWLLRVSNSELGRYGIWITDTVEIFLPALDSMPLLTYYYLNQITRLTGGTSTDLDDVPIFAYVVNTIFEVEIDGRGTSQWSKEIWDGGGTPSSDTTVGIIKPVDWNISTNNFVLVRERGW